jgi:hydrogenase 3 maturation protease
MDLEAGLKEFFGEGEKKVVLVGIGETLRGDDGVGIKIIELLEEVPMNNVMLLNTGPVPEAFTGKVVEHKPTHMLLLDAANFRGEPGDVKLIESSKIGGQTISTHTLPLTIFISYIENTLDVKVLLLGVQPRNIEFYSEMSPKVAETAEKVAALLAKMLG